MVPITRKFSLMGGAGSFLAGRHLVLLNPRGLSLRRADNGGVSPLRTLPLALATSGPDTRNFEGMQQTWGLIHKDLYTGAFRSKWRVRYTDRYSHSVAGDETEPGLQK